MISVKNKGEINRLVKVENWKGNTDTNQRLEWGEHNNHGDKKFGIPGFFICNKLERDKQQ